MKHDQCLSQENLEPATGRSSASYHQSLSQLLSSPQPLSRLERTTGTCQVPISDACAREMLASPTSLVGRQFILRDSDLCYRIVTVSLSRHDDCMFGVQYEDTELVF